MSQPLFVTIPLTLAIILAAVATTNSCPNECNGTATPFCYIFLMDNNSISQDMGWTMCLQNGCEMTPINNQSDYDNMQLYRTCLPGQPTIWLPYQLVNSVWVHMVTSQPIGYIKWTPGEPQGGNLLEIYAGDMDDADSVYHATNGVVCICSSTSTTTTTTTKATETATTTTATSTATINATKSIATTTGVTTSAPPIVVDLYSNITTLPVAEFVAFLAATNYSKADYPRNFREIPTEVDVSVQLIKLSSVSESTNTFDVDLSVTITWLDYRLNYAKSNMANGTFQLTYIDEQQLIWHPTLFIVNAQNSVTPEVLLKNSVNFVLSDGTVILQQRVVATAGCPMKLEKYPFDTQNCYLKFSLYGYFASQLSLIWRYPKPLIPPGESDFPPLEMPADVTLPNFDIFKTDIGLQQKDAHQDVYCGKYRPCLYVQLTLDRKVSYHVLRTYLPSTFVLIVSWISFWIHPQNVPARFGLGITTFLTLQTASANTQARLPAISYLTALDVWLLYCQISVFLCLVEYAFVHTLATDLWSFNGFKNRLSSLFLLSNTKFTQTAAVPMETNDQFHCQSTILEIFGPSHYSPHPNYFDFVSRRIFPLSFLLFLIVYLSYYLNELYIDACNVAHSCCILFLLHMRA